jgi:hypothetical protein
MAMVYLKYLDVECLLTVVNMSKHTTLGDRISEKSMGMDRTCLRSISGVDNISASLGVAKPDLQTSSNVPVMLLVSPPIIDEQM